MLASHIKSSFFSCSSSIGFACTLPFFGHLNGKKPIVFQDLKGHLTFLVGRREEGEVPNFQWKTSWNLSYAQQLLGEVNGLRVGWSCPQFFSLKNAGGQKLRTSLGLTKVTCQFPWVFFRSQVVFTTILWYPMCQDRISTPSWGEVPMRLHTMLEIWDKPASWPLPHIKNCWRKVAECSGTPPLPSVFKQIMETSKKIWKNVGFHVGFQHQKLESSESLAAGVIREYHSKLWEVPTTASEISGRCWPNQKNRNFHQSITKSLRKEPHMGKHQIPDSGCSTSWYKRFTNKSFTELPSTSIYPPEN